MKQFLMLSLVLLAPFDLKAQPTVELEVHASGLGYLVDIAHAGDQRIFCLSKPGLVNIVENGIVLPLPFLNISDQVLNSGEQGALGLAFDPEYATNGRFYIHYNSDIGSNHSRISRFTVSAGDPNIADPASEEIIYTIMQSSSIHKGGDLDFGPDGMLYITFGDFGSSPNAQNYSVAQGSILRLDVSGDEGYAVPVDNPYATAIDTLPEIWAKGLRNPWRFGFDALTGDLWVGDVGSSSWEEVNLWPAGDHSGPNFGWRCYEGFQQVTSTTGCGPITEYVMPIAVQPTSGAWCSLIGGRVYRGSNFPDLYGRYIYSDYCAGLIYSLLPDGQGGWVNEQLASGLQNGITCIGENNALELFLGKSNGTLYRIVDPLNVGVEEPIAPVMSAYPNPVSDQLMIEIGGGSIAHVQLFDTAGRILLDRRMEGVDRVALDVSDLPNGMYVLMVKVGDARTLRHVVSVIH